MTSLSSASSADHQQGVDDLKNAIVSVRKLPQIRSYQDDIRDACRDLNISLPEKLSDDEWDVATQALAKVPSGGNYTHFWSAFDGIMAKKIKDSEKDRDVKEAA